MYLTGGQFKGFKIEVPQTVKPTLSKVRESVFNIIFQYDLNDNKFLNMFSGSGIMGLEAISRGYEVKELEISPKVAQTIKSNYQKLKLKSDITICNSLNYKTNDRYDIIYVDPPWDMDYSLILKKAKELLNQNGIIIVEHDLKRDIDIQMLIEKMNIDIKLIKSKKYGRCLISILR